MDSKGETKADGENSKEMYLVTARGKITCLRCTAQSTRTKSQCARPALKSSRTQKCQYHGGRQHSEETLKRISEANILHGDCTKAAKKQYRETSVFLRELEDAIYVLKMAEGQPKIRGRKPDGYRGVYSEEDVIRMMRERLYRA